MHEVLINKTIVRIPSSWDELTRKQLQVIAGLSSSGCTEMQMKTHLLFYVAGIQVRKAAPTRNPANRWEDLYSVRLQDGSTALLSPSLVTHLGNLFSYLFKIIQKDDKTTAIQIDSQLTVNLVPRVKLSGVYYYGPSDKLFNITLSEFIHAETNLGRYLKTREIVYLDKLIAILYRPKGNDPNATDFNGDIRQPFNDHRIDYHARKVHKLMMNVKLSILYFYQGCQQWYQRQFPHVFSPGKKKADNNLGFLNLVDALTGGDVSKTDEIRQSYLMDVMVHLERSAIEYEEMEAKLKKK